MSNNDEYVYVDCFYYGFYIKKSELKKYECKPTDLNMLNSCCDFFNHYKLSEQLNNIKTQIMYKLSVLKNLIIIDNNLLITY